MVLQELGSFTVKEDRFLVSTLLTFPCTHLTILHLTNLWVPFHIRLIPQRGCSVSFCRMQPVLRAW